MNTRTKRVAIYARVSTDDKAQDPERQLMQLREWCERSGHEIVQEYVEHVSGRKSSADRKALGQLLDDAHRRQFDLVLFWSLDRFSREGMTKTVGYLQRLDAAGVSFHSYSEPMLTTDNELVRDVMIAVMASLAKQEAIKISENTKSGLARAKAKGKRLGRPALSVGIVRHIKQLRQEQPKLSARKIAKHLGIAHTSVNQVLKQ